jgi:hypothetical protein
MASKYKFRKPGVGQGGPVGCKDSGVTDSLECHLWQETPCAMQYLLTKTKCQSVKTKAVTWCMKSENRFANLLTDHL